MVQTNSPFRRLPSLPIHSIRCALMLMRWLWGIEWVSDNFPSYFHFYYNFSSFCIFTPPIRIVKISFNGVTNFLSYIVIILHSILFHFPIFLCVMHIPYIGILLFSALASVVAADCCSCCCCYIHQWRLCCHKRWRRYSSFYTFRGCGGKKYKEKSVFRRNFLECIWVELKKIYSLI